MVMQDPRTLLIHPLPQAQVLGVLEMGVQVLKRRNASCLQR